MSIQKAFLIVQNQELTDWIANQMMSMLPKTEIINVEETDFGKASYFFSDSSLIFAEMPYCESIFNKFSNYTKNYQLIILSDESRFNNNWLSFRLGGFFCRHEQFKKDFVVTLKHCISSIEQRIKEGFSNHDMELLLMQSKQLKVLIPHKEGTNLIESEKIISISPQKGNSLFKFIDGHTMISELPINAWQERLFHLGFERIHKSYIVNVRHIERYIKSDLEIEMIDGSRIPVSAVKKMSLKNALERNSISIKN